MSGWSVHLLFCMGMLKGYQMISRGIPSLTLIGASVNSWTVLGWLMCSTGCRSMGRPVNSVSAFVNQQLLTHIAIHRKEPTQGPRHQQASVCCCQTASAGLASGCQPLTPPSLSLILTVWAETWTPGSRKWYWCWAVAFPRPLHLLLVCLSVHWYLIHVLDTVLGNTANGLSRAHGHSRSGGERQQYWL